MRMFRAVALSCVLGLVIPAHAVGAQQGKRVVPPSKFELSLGADGSNMPYEIARGCDNTKEEDRIGFGAQFAVRARPARGIVIQADVRKTATSGYDCVAVERVYTIDANTSERRSNFIPELGSPGAGHVESMLRAGAEIGYSNLRVRALAGVGLMPAKRSLPLYSASIAVASDLLFVEAEFMRTRIDGTTVVDRRFAPPAATPVKTIIVTAVRRTPSWMTYRAGLVMPLGRRRRP